MLYFGRNSSANNIISRLIVFRDIVLEENILNIRQIDMSPGMRFNITIAPFKAQNPLISGFSTFS